MKKNNNALILWSIIFRILLEIVYCTIIHKNYTVFTLQINIEKYIVSWVVFLISIFIIRKINLSKGLKTSIIISFLVYILSYVPLISFWSLTNLSYQFFILINIYWFLILLLIYFYSQINFKIKRVNFGKKFSTLTINTIFLIATAFALYYSYKYNNLKIHFGIYDVYELRESAKNKNVGTLINMFSRWVSTVVFPLYAMKYFIEKKIGMFIFVCYLQLLMFSVAGHKFYLFIIPVSILAYFFYNDKYIKRIPKYLSLIVLISLMETFFLKTYFIVDLFVRRLLYVPAYLNHSYYEFFSSNDPVYFAYDMILKRLGVDPPFPVPVSQMVGSENNTNANTGMFADAYANLGFSGIIIFPIIFLFLMFLIDIVTNKIPKEYLIGIVISIIVSLINGELSSIFYNYILPLTIILLFLNIKNKKGDIPGDNLKISKVTYDP